jgi:glycogen synthase
MHLGRRARLNNILVISHQYDPVIGGVPVVARLIAKELSLARNVRLLTATASERKDNQPYPIIRSGSPATDFVEFARADAVIMIGPSVRAGWPALLFGKPTIVSHQAGVPNGLAQRLLSASITNVACSKYLANQIGAHVIAIGNPFDTVQFKLPVGDAPRRDRDWVCVARLVRDKGVDIFINALSLLRRVGWRGTATVIGHGPEENHLKSLATKLDLDAAIDFTGPLTGQSLVEMICRHRTGVVPSRWQEPFGIIALELLACSCSVIGARVGGLPEAMGPCGVTFEAGDPQSLATAMAETLRNPKPTISSSETVEKHLDKHRPSYVVAQYMQLLDGYR